MFKPSVMRPGMLIAALGLQALFTTAAFAHGTTIAAEAVCGSDGTQLIEFVSDSWSPNQFEGENSDVRIGVNGVVVVMGKYELPFSR